MWYDSYSRYFRRIVQGKLSSGLSFKSCKCIILQHLTLNLYLLSSFSKAKKVLILHFVHFIFPSFQSIDAYFTTSKARYINDAKETQANTFVKKVEVHGVPRLFIYSKKKIEKGTEIRYDYGNPDAEWRQVS